MIAKESLEKIGLRQSFKNKFEFSDLEDFVYLANTGELYSRDCTNGDLTLEGQTKDLADLKQMLWDLFPYNRNQLNLD